MDGFTRRTKEVWVCCTVDPAWDQVFKVPCSARNADPVICADPNRTTVFGKSLQHGSTPTYDIVPADIDFDDI